MKRQITPRLVIVLSLSVSLASPIFGQHLSLGSAEGEFGTSVDIPLTLSTSPGGESIQAVQAIFGWDGAAGTGLDVFVDPAIEADADFVSVHVADDWIALGFTVVTAPLTEDDIPLATAVIQCGAGPEATDTPITFTDGVHSVPGSSLVLSNTVTINGSSVRRENGLLLTDGSFRCFGTEVCDDGVDNDGDGLVDGSDSECPSEIDVAPLALGFGDVFVGAEKTLPVTIRNTGAAALTISTIEIGTPGNPDFTISEAPATPAAIPPGEELVVSVTYAPQEAGSDTGTLKILSDDADEPELTVPLSGSGRSTQTGGLAAHLPLDCTAEDLVSGEVGVVMGQVGCDTDRFSEPDSSMSFDGSGWVSGDSFPVVSGDFILEVWALLGDDADPSAATVLRVHNPDDPVQVPGLSLEWDATAHLLMLKRDDHPIAVEGLAADWHHLLIARELGQLSLYVDGQLEASTADSDLLGGAYALGADPDGSRRFEGRLDELILDVEALGGDEGAINRSLRGGPSVYIHPGERVRDLTANPGFTAEALALHIRTANSELGELELADLVLVAEDVTSEGGASPPLDYLQNGRIVLQPQCGVTDSETTVGQLVLRESNLGSAKFSLMTTAPIRLPPASEICLAALFLLDAQAPLNRTFQFRIESLEDIQIVDAQSQGRYPVGQRLNDRPALEGDRLKILSAPPPELALSFPVGMEPVNAGAALPDAAMHRLGLETGASEGLRLLDIAYRPAEGTGLDGLTNARVFVDLNGNGALDAGETTQSGAVDVEGRQVRFTALGIEIPASSRIELVLLADLEVPGASVGGAMVSILLVLAGGGVSLLLARRLRCPSELASVAALLVICCAIGIGAGCGGGGGGGGSSAPATTEQSFQLTVQSAADIRAEGLISGTEPNLGVFPPGGLPGTQFFLRG